ncbi:hypothetical protein MNBD_GAMMA25-170 [hydrothermal vent metagenome]|uniref:Cytochrome C oxidase subunit III n=1 Tax=hydrothermal vent metagenome TaxID=652676 RepID=A0A3B1AI18_9ZZZZ
MRPSANKDEVVVDGQSLAVLAQSLYLANLLLLPGLSFLALVYLFMKHRTSAPPLARNHLSETLRASLWAGAMIMLVNFGIFLAGGYDSVWTWVALIIYFTSIHATFVLLGMLGLSRAMAGKCYRFPLPY